jgi:hypothetical protein
MIEVAEAGRGDGGVGNRAVLDDGDAGAEHRVRLHVVRRAIDGIEQPGTPVLRYGSASLFGEYGVVGVALLDGVHHQLLAQEVDLGYEVLRSLLPDLTRVLVTR